MNRTLIRSLLISLSAIAVLLSGCAAQRPVTDPALDQKAFALSNQISSFNSDILTAKGTGWLRIETEEKKEKYRIAWATRFPDNIRITFLVSGLPIETVAASGGQITFFSHTGSHELHSYKAEDPDMGKYLQMPVRMSRIISMLLGRYPVAEFDDAYFIENSEEESTIMLRETGQKETQSLQLSGQGLLQEIAVNDFSGFPLYRIGIQGVKTFNGRHIPFHYSIRDRLGRKLFLQITGFSVNPEIKEGIFQLTEGG